MRIPVPQPYQRQVTQSGRTGTPLVSGVPLTGVQDLARGAAMAAGAFERDRAEREERAARVEQEQRKARVQDRTRDDWLHWTQQMEEREAGAPAGADGFTDTVARDFSAYRKQAVESIQDEAERRMYDERLGMLSDRLVERAVVFQSGQRRSYRKQVLSDGLNKSARTLAIDPTLHAEMLAQELAAINDSADFNAAEKAEMATSAREGLSWQAAQTLTMRNPAAMLQRLDSKDINADPILGQLKPERLQQIRAAAMTEVARGVAGERTRLIAQERDIQAMVMAGEVPPTAPTREEYVKAFGPDGAMRWDTEVGTYLQVGDGIRKMKDAGPEVRAAIIAAAAPQPGPGYAEAAKVHTAMVQAARAIDKRLTDDPARYALESSERVAQAQRVLVNETAGPGRDTGDAAARAQRIGVTDFYARTMIAEQTRMGVQQPRLLTEDQAKAIVQQFYDQQQGGKKAAELIAGLEETWGRWWPTVYSQLASDAKLPPAALVIPNMKDAGARQRLAEWSAMKPAERKALLQPTDERDIRDAVLSRFTPAAASFLAQGGAGQRTAAVIIDQAEILAAGYRAQGKSIGDAAEQAYEEVMGWKYDFGPTYRVPKDQQHGQVEQGTRAFLSALRDVRVPGIPGMDDEAVREQTLDAVRTNAVWVTNRDETGLRLMVKGQDGGVYQVADAAGRPIEASWGHLRSAALTQRTVDALRQPKLPDVKATQPKR
jgi:hypothetical protein